MKSLEKVIKLKSRLIDVRKPETNSISEIFVQHHESEKLIYLAKDLNNKTIIELVQQITPLIYHLISKYRHEEEKSLGIELKFLPNKPSLSFKRTFKINDESPLNLSKILKPKVIFLPLLNILISNFFLKIRKLKKKLKYRIPLKVEN